MRATLRTSVAVAACLLLIFGIQMPAQSDPISGQTSSEQTTSEQTNGQPSGPPQDAGPYGGGRSPAMGRPAPPVQGIVTAVTAGKLTLKTDAGDLYEVSASATARIMENRQTIPLASIKIGDSVTVFGAVDSTKKTVQAIMLSVIDAATVARAKENLGKTYITGKITGIDGDNLKLTILRTDNVSQTITVDDGTSFQRGTRGVSADVIAAGGLPSGMGGMGGGRGMGGNGMGGNRQGGTPPPPPPTESITLADIKVGDSVMGTGTLKSGVFTALKLGVTDAAAGARRRSPEAPSGPLPDAPPNGAPSSDSLPFGPPPAPPQQ